MSNRNGDSGFSSTDEKSHNGLLEMLKKPSSPGSQNPQAKHARFSVNNVNGVADSNQDNGNDEEINNERSPFINKKSEHIKFEVDKIDLQNDVEKNNGTVSPISHDINQEDETQKTHNASGLTYTYNTVYARSLTGYITEALPRESHYRNFFSITKNSKRPTLDELQRGKSGKQVDEKDPESGKGEEEPQKGKVIKFGWIQGVYMRCLLNIWGVMLFLRLTWVVGQAGIVQGVLVITLANIVTVITAISMSAVSTNGQIKGGGIYYMISRSLGPEFGGAIGIMFTLANSIAVSMYIIGFCDSLIDMLNEVITEYPGITGSPDSPESRLNDVRIIGIITLIAVLALAVVGMDWVTRVQVALLGLLLLSQVDFFVGSFMIKEENRKFGIVGYNIENFKSNIDATYHDYKHSKEDADHDKPSFFSVFGVFFPAVTGIVAGANLSGDLKDPGVAIPKGTLLAIATTYVSYIAYAFMIGALTIPDASGVEEEYLAWADNWTNDTLKYNNCSTRLELKAMNDDIKVCEYGSANDQQCMAKISYTWYLIFAGCFAATLSSAIASLVGAPRVLQALAKDKLYPLVHFFSKGYGANNDPFRGYILVFLISAGCILIGKLDVVSTLLSNFFVAAYALINFSVFHASITKSPGWRPAFKYYNQWVSLIGSALCLAVMFLIDWQTALITFVVIGILYFYISYRKPEANWGSSTQAQQFVLTLKGVQTLNEVPDHVKNYRPKVLVLSGIPAHRQPLVDFAHLVTKKLSLLICSHVETEEASNVLFEGLKKNVNLWLRDHGIKAFFSTNYNKNFADGAIACMDLVGLGKLTPNMVLMGFKSDWHKDSDGCEDYINVIHHGFDIHMAMGILRLRNGCDYSDVIGKEEQIIIGGGDDSNKKSNSEENSDDGNEEQAKATGNLVVGNTGNKKTSVAVYHGIDGNPLDNKIVSDITQFQAKKRKGTIDVWWLYDDGGLTLLLPHILTTRSQFKECSLRVFALANRRDQLDLETRNMISLLAKFRIDYSDVTVIPDVTKKAKDSTKAELLEMLNNVDGKPSENELSANREKTNRHLRLTELLREHSTNSEMVIMTLPMPRKGATPPALYMSWLDMMTKNMPPFLLLRGNQTSVLTFYS